MGIEKYVSFTRNAMFGLGLSALVGLTACRTMFEVPKIVAEEIIRISYTITTLPSEIILPGLKREPAINECIETPKEKVCRLYLGEIIPELGKREYFGVFKIEKGFFGNDQQRLILAYWDEDRTTRTYTEENEDEPLRDDEKYLIVVMYTGESSREFVEPVFGKTDVSYTDFIRFFNEPRKNELDTSDNQLKMAKERGFFDEVKTVAFLKMLNEKIGVALELADEQLPKSNK